MDHINLEIFRAVASELSITRAAKRLGRVPSNVTTRIQQLEAELGVELFVRDGNRLTLSGEGQRFVDYADRLIALADEARQVLRPQAPMGVLRVGTMDSTAAARLPGPLARFHTRWPDVQLNVSTQTSRQLIESVRSGLLDCALAALPPCSDLATAADLESIGLHAERVFKEELLIVAPPGHRALRKPGDLDLRSLAAFAQGCSYRALIEDWLGDTAATLVVQEVGSYHAMLACVASGSSFCLVPRSVLDLMRDPPEFQTHTIARMDTWLIRRHGFETAAFTAWREILMPADTSQPHEARSPRNLARSSSQKRAA
ncbi:HTH-type transcriptional regulator NmoR [Pararobbsia alpina]|uniref:LysR family transcriptional regulator n=1 Tax=Pararobbsia alpina TaxID=621374 RepID=UPI0039A554CB